MITGNPMGVLPKPKAARGAPSAFTDTDLGALITTLQTGAIPARRAWPTRGFAIITTLALTGLRHAELLALAVDDVEGSPGERQLSVRHSKGDKHRSVPIPPALEHLIETYLQERWSRSRSARTAHSSPRPVAGLGPGTRPRWDAACRTPR